MNTIGDMFRIVLGRLPNQRVLDVTVGDDNRVTLMFENGDTVAFGSFSYRLATEEAVAEIKEKIMSATEVTADGLCELASAEGDFNFNFEMEEDDDES